MSNDPKILLELSEEEAKWLLDRLHEEWVRSVSARAIVTSAETAEKVNAHKKMGIEIKNRLEENAFKQGFGCI